MIRNQWAGFLALFFVLAGGGAVAAFDPIGGDGDFDACFERKTGDLDLLKGKKCGKSEKQVSWSETGPPGPPGDPGAPGEMGAQGPVGRSALEPLRNGETVRGVVGTQENAPAGSLEYYTLASLPVPAPEPLTNERVVADGAYENTTTCTGSFTNPTAPAGFVCIYGAHPSFGVNTDDEEGTAAAFNDGATPYGFALRWYSTAAGEARVAATWAYTAP